MQADRAESSNLQGRATHEGTRARLEVAGRMSDGSRGLGLRLDGAVVAAGGGVFLSRRINDSFAVVDAGAPGVEVRAENRPVGQTGRGGKLLVPDLRAYEPNRLSIDPTNLPVDAVVSSTHQTIRPAPASYSSAFTRNPIDVRVNYRTCNLLLQDVQPAADLS